MPRGDAVITGFSGGMRVNQVCTLSLSCADRPGLVAVVAGFLAARGGNILDAQQFNDQATERFFMRVDFALAEGDDAGHWRANFSSIAATYGMDWKLRQAAELQRVLLLVSKFDHCLGDLLYRWRTGELDMDVVGIVSNHPREALTTSLIESCLTDVYNRTR